MEKLEFKDLDVIRKAMKSRNAMLEMMIKTDVQKEQSVKFLEENNSVLNKIERMIRSH